MTHDEAMKLARTLKDMCRFHAPDQACDIRRLCDHILSGDTKREIENAAYEQAKRLATVLWEKHWKDQSPNWEAADNLTGILLQIDNMTVGLIPPPAQEEN